MVQAFQNQEQIYKLKLIFMAIDDDHSGTIQKNEFIIFFSNHAAHIPINTLEGIFDSMYI